MLSPASLLLTPEQAAVQAQRNALIAELTARLPGVAISVWSARTDPRNPATSRLLCYNTEFLDLCDAPHFADGEFFRVVVRVTDAYFTSKETAAAAVASRNRVIQMGDALAQGVRRTSAILIHISRVGRLKVVYAELLGVFLFGRLAEMILAEQLLPADTPIPADLQRPYGVVDERHIRDSDILASAPAPPDMPLDWVIPAPQDIWPAPPPQPSPSPLPAPAAQDLTRLPPRVEEMQMSDDSPHAIERRAKKKRVLLGPFECKLCKSTETSQRRRGPDGTLSLCNRCGLRWRRIMAHMDQHRGAGTAQHAPAHASPHPHAHALPHTHAHAQAPPHRGGLRSPAHSSPDSVASSSSAASAPPALTASPAADPMETSNFVLRHSDERDPVVTQHSPS